MEGGSWRWSGAVAAGAAAAPNMAEMEMEYWFLVVIFSLALCCPILWNLPRLFGWLRDGFAARAPKVEPAKSPRLRDVDLPGRSTWLAKRKAQQEAVRIKSPKRKRGHEIDARRWGAEQHYAADGRILSPQVAWGEEVDLAKSRVPLGEKRRMQAFTHKSVHE